MCEIERRAALLLPAVVGLSALPLKSRAQDALGFAEAFANAEASFREETISRYGEFSEFFNVVWRLRTALAFASVADGSEDTLRQIIFEAEDRLQVNSGDGISEELSQEIKKNTIRFQNAVIALGTDPESGEVRIQSEIILRIRDVICPLYPFC